ncbi:hypothetical protein ACFE04_016898 [Oxalis oulophora]
MAILFNKLLTLLLSFSCLYHISSANATNFQIPQFDADTKNVLFQGDAKLSVGTIDFNSLTYTCHVGWAYYADKVRLWDSSTGEISDFSTKFTVNIDTQGSENYGQGFTFFLGPVGSVIPPNSPGGFLGLFNTTTTFSPSNQIILVEFDAYKNQEWDPNDVQGHIGINNNSISSVNYTSWNASFHSGDPADVQIKYNATLKNLSVAWTYQTTRASLENSSLSYIIHLSKVLPEWVMIGFSAATGAYMEQHTLSSWEFTSSLDVNGSTGETAKKWRVIGGIWVLLLRTNLTSINDDLERGVGPRRFTHVNLASATNNFSDQRKLGQGGFGSVYRGYLNDLDIAIAVKKISRSSKQGKKEYLTEVKIISQLRHRNLVQLIGWCHEKGDLLLVYEYMPNGSLDYHLFGKRTPLNWDVRYNIALGLASGLLYLHEEWEQCVVHRDIKSSNVMLDSIFSAKLGDFGLARLMDHELGLRTTGLAGTFGYLAPECLSARRASKESDVYSFGVVALEIATGKQANNFMEERPQYGLIGWVWNLYENGQLDSAIDNKLNTNYDRNQVERLLIVGLWCAYPDFTKRPSIRQAIQVIKFEAEMPDLPTKMPVPTFHVPTPSIDSEATSSTGEISRATITNSSIYQVPAGSSGDSGEPLVSYSSINFGGWLRAGDGSFFPKKDSRKTDGSQSISSSRLERSNSTGQGSRDRVGEAQQCIVQSSSVKPVCQESLNLGISKFTKKMKSKEVIIFGSKEVINGPSLIQPPNNLDVGPLGLKRPRSPECKSISTRPLVSPIASRTRTRNLKQEARQRFIRSLDLHQEVT